MRIMGVDVQGVLVMVAAGLLSTMPVSAQPKPAGPPPYVASIRPAGGAPGGFQITPGLFRAGDVTARLLIAIGYGLQPWQITGGPGWLDTDRFDVEARLESDADQGSEGMMIKAMLADRFHLVLHPDTGDASIYALEVAANGPNQLNLKRSEVSEKLSMDFRAASLEGKAAPIGLFASLIATRLGRNVIDRTNLTGRYDIHLKWTPDAPASAPAGAAALAEPIDSSGPSLFTAIQEQLGLRLRPVRGPSGFLVVDHMEKPSAN
ncbi:MAG TPA: TIGR03435 family protein [Bryobacteraceae bacterium]|nr:TIGR03435 family protein [Bryobacteraceae bacterium]